MRNYLIVDDNEAFAENMAEIIRDTGDEVSVVTSGEAALELAQKTRFDALLTDMRMPVMGGAELVHRVRRIDPGLPAIVITAYTNDDDLEAARREGLLAVLSKPVTVPRMLETLRAARRDGLIALVEDDPSLADNLSEVLRGRGFSAVMARSVTETERLGAVKPFAALVDLRVPGGPDGTAMRKLGDKYPGLPMLVITAHGDVPPPLQPEETFRKPFQTPRLLEAIERLYRASHA